MPELSAKGRYEDMKIWIAHEDGDIIARGKSREEVIEKAKKKGFYDFEVEATFQMESDLLL